MDHRAQSLIVLMQSNLRRELTLSEMAQHVNLTPEHLCRIFKSETGRSPAKYFKCLKMQRARELLENTYLSVKEIMAAVGLKDESHFVRDFEAAYGLTPARYRAALVKGPLSQYKSAAQAVKIG
jgi:transcriptional regulator GlxA family with amidase domain